MKNSENIKCSLILTTYNCEANLKRTLESIEAQDYDNIEVCIKDGSRDMPECACDGSVIETLARIVQTTGRKFVAIIDEWDAVIRDDKFTDEERKDFLQFLRTLFKNSSAADKVFAAAYMTGILPIKKNIHNPNSVMRAIYNKAFQSYWQMTSAADSLLGWLNYDNYGPGEVVPDLLMGKTYIESGTLIYQEKASQAELPDEYRQSDVFLFPSKYEIFGMVLLEAMYFGLPVISSYNGGSSVLIKDESDSKGQRNELSNTANGIIVKELSVSEWADSIETLISNKERLKAMGENAANTIREHFLWDRLADSFIDAYEEAIK